MRGDGNGIHRVTTSIYSNYTKNKILPDTSNLHRKLDEHITKSSPITRNMYNFVNSFNYIW